MPRPFEVARGAPLGRVARFVLATSLALIALSAPGAALGNGAFPESYQIVLPADHPQQVILATNFGLIISDDEGATWTWTCEQSATTNGMLYGVSGSPLDRLYSASQDVGLAWSDDSSCTWTSAAGSLKTILATDYFSDPTNSMRVYALGKLGADDTSAPRVVASDDGGETFGAPLYTAPAQTAPATFSLQGVESARSDPKTIYLAAYQSVQSTFHPKLERSIDGGQTWTEIDVEPSLGGNGFRIIAVDPADANALTVRVIEPLGESLAISHDGGMTFQKKFMVAGQLTSYARLDSGTIVVAGALATDGVGYRSTDGGATFVDWTPAVTDAAGVPDLGPDGGAPRPPHMRALAARGGKLYVAAKNFSDGWAIGVSTDDGATIARLAKYDQVSAIRPCAQAVCASNCLKQAGMDIWPASVCGTSGTGGTGGAGGTGGMTPPPKKGGGCAIGAVGTGAGALGDASGAGLLAVLASLAALCVARVRRRR
jgi:hypothetical protein